MATRCSRVLVLFLTIVGSVFLNGSSVVARVADGGISNIHTGNRSSPLVVEDNIAGRTKHYVRRLLREDDIVHEAAGLELKDKVYAAIRARIPLRNPILEDEETERSSTFIAASSPDSEIQVGWEVYPKRHGDTNTHVFVLTKNATHSWYDQQDNHCFRLVPGISLMSQDESLFELRLTARRQWHLKIDSDIVGRWPLECLPGLETGATSLFWGGQVSFGGPKSLTATEMGSGFLPSPDVHFDAAAFLYNVQYKRLGTGRSRLSYQSPTVLGELRAGRHVPRNGDYTAYGCPSTHNCHPPGAPERGYVVYYGGPLLMLPELDIPISTP